MSKHGCNTYAVGGSHPSLFLNFFQVPKFWGTAAVMTVTSAVGVHGLFPTASPGSHSSVAGIETSACKGPSLSVC